MSTAHSVEAVSYTHLDVYKRQNLGDAKSTITHPATTTHSRITAEARAEAGIKDNLVRIAVGLEHVDDLKTDLRF